MCPSSAECPPTVTTPVASPGVVAWTGHGLVEGSTFSISGGTLPSPLMAGSTYYVKYVDADTFQLSDTVGGTAFNFTGTSSGTQTGVGMPLDNFKVAATVGGANINTSGAQSGTQTSFSNDGAIYGVPPTVALTSISNATPAVCTLTNHGLRKYDSIYFTTTGTLPTGLSLATKYFVIYVDANTFQVTSSITSGNTLVPINTSSAGSGTHSFTKYSNDMWGEQAFNISNVPLAVSVVITGIITGSNVRVSQTNDNTELSNGTESANRYSFNTLYSGTVTVRIRKVGYLPLETTGVVGASGLSLLVTQIVDTYA